MSPQLAAAVAARLATNNVAAPRRNRAPHATLLRGGLAICGACKHPLRVRHDDSDPTRAPRTRYICDHGARTHQQACRSHTIEAHKLDAAVWEKVAAILRDPALIRAEVARLHAAEARGEQPGASVLAAIGSQIAEVRRKIRNKRAYAEDMDDARERAEVATEVKLLRKQEDRLEAERLAAQAHYADYHRRARELERAVA